MDSFTAIVARGNVILRDSTTTSEMALSPAQVDLVIILMVLILISLVMGSGLYIFRKIRQKKSLSRQSLPQYEPSAPSSSQNIHKHSRSNSRRLTISTSGGYGNNSSSVYVYDEKSPMMKEMGMSSGAGECSPTDVPEIRITFPEELDAEGRRKSGRVVVVRVTDTGVGLEPLRDEEREEQLPAYEKEMGGRFQSIDMDRIGGLKEKSEY